MILDWLKGSREKIPNDSMSFVDVRDTAAAHILLYEKGQGRHLCIAESQHYKTTYELLKKLEPTSKVPTEMDMKEGDEMAKPTPFTCKSLEDLGLKFRSVEETFKDTIASLKEKGLMA
mmetsp:Transcript_6317/g.9984  ORF Transcript_6317/g.9984 Transcript_6317/m.9984 type:complete len:118 (+) Transcript_6317:2-355(+)